MHTHQDVVQKAISSAASEDWGDFLKRLQQMYPVCETDLSVRTVIEELPSLPEIPTAARISEFVAQLKELMRHMDPKSYGPTEPHLSLVGKIPERCGLTVGRRPGGKLGCTPTMTWSIC